MSLAELNQILESSRQARKEQNTFLAAIQGVDLSKGETSADSFEDVKRRVQAKLSGVDEEQLDLSEMGIQIETEDE